MDKKKIRVAFIYKEFSDAVSGNYFASTYYHFFMDALIRNEKINITYFPAKNSFDTTILKDKFDIILLCDNHPSGTPDELIGIQELNIPVVCRVNDPHDVHSKGKIKYHEK